MTDIWIFGGIDSFLNGFLQTINREVTNGIGAEFGGDFFDRLVRSDQILRVGNVDAHETGVHDRRRRHTNVHLKYMQLGKEDRNSRNAPLWRRAA